MRIFNIDYTASNKLPDGDTVGKYGEHNATLLSITPPSEMSENAEIVFYRIAFGLTNCRTVHSEKIEKAETVSYLLNAQITRSDIISVQLVGYDAENKLVMKSETVKKLKFAESVGGIEVDPDGKSYNIGAEVNALQKKVENFSEDADGSLTYKDKAIQFEKVKDVVTYESPDLFYISSVGNSWLLIDMADAFQKGTKILDVEFWVRNEWVSVNSMFRIDAVPYTVFMDRVFFSMGEPAIIMVYFPERMNSVFNALNEGAIEQMRVTFLPKSEEVTNE